MTQRSSTYCKALTLPRHHVFFPYLHIEVDGLNIVGGKKKNYLAGVKVSLERIQSLRYMKPPHSSPMTLQESIPSFILAPSVFMLLFSLFPSLLFTDQGFYNQAVLVDPDDPDIVYVGGSLVTVKTINGGASWSYLTYFPVNDDAEANPRGLPIVHADQHCSAKLTSVRM